MRDFSRGESFALFFIGFSALTLAGFFLYIVAQAVYEKAEPSSNALDPPVEGDIHMYDETYVDGAKNADDLVIGPIEYPIPGTLTIVADDGHDILMSSEGPEYTCISITSPDWSVEINWHDGPIEIVGDPNHYTDAAKLFFENVCPEAAYSIVRQNKLLLKRLIDDGAFEITPQ